MGLDMILHAKKTLNPDNVIEKQYIDYIENEVEFKCDTVYFSMFIEHEKRILDELDALPSIHGQIGGIYSISKQDNRYTICTEAAYWRKAWQFHTWFTLNSNMDTSVEIDKLKELYLILKSFGRLPNIDFDTEQWIPSKELVLVAEKLLPNPTGIYDDWYFGHIKYTKQVLKKLLNTPFMDEWHYYYDASW